MYGIHYEPSTEELVVLVNIGASVMNINILKGDFSIFSRDISIGGNPYTKAIQRELGVSCEEAERLKKEGLVVLSPPSPTPHWLPTSFMK